MAVESRGPSLERASGVLATNLRVAGLIGAASLACALVGAPPRDRPARVTLFAVEIGVGVVAFANAIAIGAALGALGAPALGRSLVHAPLELGAFALCFAGFLRARRGELALRAGALGAAVVLAALALGAIVETSVSARL